MDGREQHAHERQPEQPADHREHRPEQMVEREHPGAQHRDPVEVDRPLVVLDGGDLGLEPGDAALEHDVQPVAEPPGRAVEGHRQCPHQGRGHREPDGPDVDPRLVVVHQAVCDQGQPDADQDVGQRLERGHRQRGPQQLRLRAVAVLDHADHRRQSRRHLARGVLAGRLRVALVKATHAGPPPRARPAPARRGSGWPGGRTSCGSAHAAPSARRGCRARSRARARRRRSAPPV